jgi:tRNA pseudouridine38-40 synthase
VNDADEPALPAGEGGLSRAAAHGVPEGLVRVRLDVAYDGTAYAGWARQLDRPSVQAAIEDAVSTVLRGPSPRLTVAGRTDAGVHARGQVAHVDLPSEVAEDRLLRRKLNGLLPLDIRIRKVSTAPPGFDARFSATSRTYRYRIADRPDNVDPLRRGEVYVVPRPLDLDAMRRACAPMLGTHDFAAYCRRREGATTIRGLLELDWARDADGLLVMTVRADAFCHSMVRSLVGAMLAVGEGRRSPEWPASLLTLGSRATDVVVVPPHGLVLEAVEYPGDDELLSRQGITRNLRV